MGERPETVRARHERHRGTCADCGGPTSWPGGDNGPPTRCQACYRARRAATAKRAEHGTRSRYEAGCKCEACKAAHADYHRAMYRRQREAAGHTVHPYGPRRRPDAP